MSWEYDSFVEFHPQGVVGGRACNSIGFRKSGYYPESLAPMDSGILSYSADVCRFPEVPDTGHNGLESSATTRFMVHNAATRFARIAQPFTYESSARPRPKDHEMPLKCGIHDVTPGRLFTAIGWTK
jgi:hypothetical protein